MPRARATGRRGFLKGAAAGGVAALATPLSGRAAGASDAVVQTVAQTSAGPRPAAPVSVAAEVGSAPSDRIYASCGGDYMVDVMRALNIDYFAATPGATFMGVHEAVINYGMLSQPRLRFITTMHEEASVAMAHGYAKIEGKPMACMVHSTVGLQHASMAIYNAYADRVPVFMMMGASLDASRRKSSVDWMHAATDGAAIVRDFTKWDDQPGSLRAFGEAAVRGYKFSTTPPYGPVLLAVDSLMQEEPIPGGSPPPIPPMPSISPPAGEEGAIRETARLLVQAEAPVIVADRMARTAEGMALLVQLAEVLQAPVCTTNNRMNFPWRHPLNQSGRQPELVAHADLLLELEPSDPFNVTTIRGPDGALRPIMRPDSKRISLSSIDLFMRSNFQDFQRFASDIDLAMAADAQASLPMLIEEVRRQLPTARQAALDARGARFAQTHAQDIASAKAAAVYGWDDRPISMPRLCMELYDQIRDEDWSLVSSSTFQSGWPQRLWQADKHYRYIGGQGAGGIGYMAPAGLGAALANSRYGRLSVCINGDGDLMMGPGILWTAAHERIPLLYIVHNNRAYHEELMQLQFTANRRQRGVDRAHIGCAITDPNIDYALLGRSMGVFSQGPIEDPKDLGPAIRRAIAVVKTGAPALIDVVSEGR